MQVLLLDYFPKDADRTPKSAMFWWLLLAAIVAACVTGNLLRGKSTRRIHSNITRAQVDIKSIESAIEAFRIECGRLPTEHEGIEALVFRPDGIADWGGPYVINAQQLLDPWHRQYQYRVDQSSNSDRYRVFSFGSDGKVGTADDIVFTANP